MSIALANLKSGDTITYSLAYLTGTVELPLSQNVIRVSNERTGLSVTWPLYGGLFKALVELLPGRNLVQLHYFEETVDVVLYYEVPNRDRFVRPVYIICHDDLGDFQGPDHENCSLESAQRRIALGAKLLQAFTAEKMHDHGFGRKTFILECDVNPGAPSCHVFTSKLSATVAREMSGGDLWMHFAKELMTSKVFKEKENSKWFAFMSFTRYQPPDGLIPKSHSEILKHTKGHTALGGGGLALLGTGNLHCWAESLDEIPTRFSDTRKIDRTKFMDDSAYRQYFWANYSTGLGAALHELGHTFDLAHTPTGIMARGFDDLYKVFTVQDSHSRSNSSSEGSRLASPIPYSPKQSPIHRTRVNSGGSRSGSPKPCPHFRPKFPMASELPLVVQFETCFRKLRKQSTQTYTMKNYDGSETRHTITRNCDGTETIAEMTIFPNGEKTAREVIKHVPSGRARTMMSMSVASPSSGNEKPMTSATLKNPYSPNPSSLPKSPEDEPHVFRFQEVHLKDGGAHWYRSSAVLLSYHRWFNTYQKSDNKIPELQRNVITCPHGIRIIELRTMPEGVVFHHWEFLHPNPPCTFQLRYQEVYSLAHSASDIAFLVEDDRGHILKRKIPLEQLRTDDG